MGGQGSLVVGTGSVPGSMVGSSASPFCPLEPTHKWTYIYFATFQRHDIGNSSMSLANFKQ